MGHPIAVATAMFSLFPCMVVGQRSSLSPSDLTDPIPLLLAAHDSTLNQIRSAEAFSSEEVSSGALAALQSAETISLNSRFVAQLSSFGSSSDARNRNIQRVFNEMKDGLEDFSESWLAESGLRRVHDASADLTARVTWVGWVLYQSPIMRRSEYRVAVWWTLEHPELGVVGAGVFGAPLTPSNRRVALTESGYTKVPELIDYLTANLPAAR